MEESRRTIADTFADKKKAGKAVFIAYTVCGFKTRADSVDILLALQDGGADIIEFGIPFSDPQADGPTIQKAHQCGVDQKIGMRDVLATVKTARSKGLRVPVILMGYFNNFLAYGLEKICVDAKSSGADGFLIVDLPPIEAKEFVKYSSQHDLSFIPLVSPTTSEDRMKSIADVASGFVYCVSLNGVTGARDALPVDISSFMEKVRRHISIPLALGFGISTREHVNQVAKVADGAIIGSKIIQTITDAPNDTQSRAQKVKEFCLTITQDE